MTPEEKAKELYNKFKEALAITDMQAGANPYVIMCCIISATQMTKQLQEMCKPEYTSFWHGKVAGETIDGYEMQQYWEDVKQAIEKL